MAVAVNALVMSGETVPAVGVTLFDGAETGPVPTALLALTVQVTAMPLVRPVTVIGDVAPDAILPPQLAV